MRNNWSAIISISLLLTACSTTEQQHVAPPEPTYNGPVVEIPGVEPRYEAIDPRTRQDYQLNGKTYEVIQDPSRFSQTGIASWYGKELKGNRTALGEEFNPLELTAAHPTLPLPSYVRVTNLANGRQLVVRVNDRGPFTSGRIIDLSQGAAERLNISSETRVRVDYIKVAPDGTLSGPGTAGTRVIKSSYALPPRPDLSGTRSTPAAPVAISDAENGKPAISSQPAATRRGGFLGAPQPLASGVLESSDSPSPDAASAVSAAVAAPGGSYMLQVGALSDPDRAQQLMQNLSQRLNVAGKVTPNGKIWRVQLGPLQSRQQAAALQQRLASENQQSFITQAQ